MTVPTPTQILVVFDLRGLAMVVAGLGQLVHWDARLQSNTHHNQVEAKGGRDQLADEGVVPGGQQLEKI